MALISMYRSSVQPSSSQSTLRSYDERAQHTVLHLHLLEAYLKASRILTAEHFSWDKLQQFFWYPTWCALLLVLDYESLANNFSKEYQT
jgi:hypothetical protein